MKKIGRYVIVSELGRGAMGVVYRASDPTIDRDVALKVLSLSQGQEEGTNSPQEMFMREVRAAGRLAHPAIVTIYDAFDDPVTQSSCIVMELVPGVTLEKILESGKPPTTDQTIGLIRQVAEALDYAHRNKVIHRDLKPANILVTQDGRAKITDFGIAKVLAREGVARTIGIMGTPSYMSPEQVRGGDIDARTDVFSLGIMIFTMLTGQKPFTGNTAAVMFKIVYEDPALPSTVNTKLSPAHDYMVRKCLAKDRNERYPSVRDLLNDLDDIQAGRPPRSQSPGHVAAVEPEPVLLHEHSEQTSADLPQLPHPAAGRPQAPRMPPPPTPVRMEPSAPSVSPSGARVPEDPTIAMPKSEPARPAPPASPSRPMTPPPASAPLGGTTLVMKIPDLAGVSSPTAPEQGSKVPPAPPGGPLLGYTLPMRVPDLNAVSAQDAAPPTVQPTPPPPPRPPVAQAPAMPAPPIAKVAVPPQAASVAYPVAPPVPKPVAVEPPRPKPPAPLPAAPTRMDTPAPVHASEVEHTIQFGDETETAPAPSKSKMVPILAAVGGLLLVAVIGGLAFWKLHKPAQTEPIQQVAQAPAVIQPPVQTPPVEALPPGPETAVATPPPATNPAPGSAPNAAKKPPVKKTKQPATAHPEPAPQPAQPAVVTPPPQPEPSGPSAADIAKAEAAKLANTPRIVNVVCEFGLKEAKFTFAGGGKTLFQDSEKGKKKKSGFLGLKGNYEGSFNHTLTVPPGVTTISVHVESKDGSTDLTNTAHMPTAAGFVPHFPLRWTTTT